MGSIFHMTCRNKACRYSVELREGEGMRLFAWIKTLERDILSGKEAAPEEKKFIKRWIWIRMCDNISMPDMP